MIQCAISRVCRDQKEARCSVVYTSHASAEASRTPAELQLPSRRRTSRVSFALATHDHPYTCPNRFDIAPITAQQCSLLLDNVHPITRCYGIYQSYRCASERRPWCAVAHTPWVTNKCLITCGNFCREASTATSKPLNFHTTVIEGPVHQRKGPLTKHIVAL